uniref:DUF4283 domain-containing protein n=1 Tax=Cannabis sativa TaxID=3483 RepID=A0A803P622_CANSA
MSGPEGRFPIIITEFEDDMFKITFGCEGDKFRVLNKEPWYFQNHLIVLHSPDVQQNVCTTNLAYTPFWVQVYRLPFLSKSKALAKVLGNIIGEFLDVHEDSLAEGWGPFLRIRVKLQVTKPLPQGQMIAYQGLRAEITG